MMFDDKSKLVTTSWTDCQPITGHIQINHFDHIHTYLQFREWGIGQIIISFINLAFLDQLKKINPGISLNNLLMDFFPVNNDILLCCLLTSFSANRTKPSNQSKSSAPPLLFIVQPALCKVCAVLKILMIAAKADFFFWDTAFLSFLWNLYVQRFSTVKVLTHSPSPIMINELS